MRSLQQTSRLNAFPRGSIILAKITAFELSEGVLIPGHRFEPLRPLDAMPWKVGVLHAGMKVPQKELAVPLRDIGMYYSFFDEVTISHYLVEDEAKNLDALASQNELARVRVRALDLGGLYKTAGLKAGDYLELSQEDEAGLSFSIRPRPAADIPHAERSAWLANLALGFRAAIQELAGPGESVELIRAAYVAAPPAVLSNPGGSLSDFLDEGGVIEFQEYAGRAYLWEKGSDIAQALMDAGMEIPEDATKLEAELVELGLSLGEDDIEAIVRDELAHGGGIDSALDRCFGDLDEADYDDSELVAVRALARDFAREIMSHIMGKKEKPAITWARSSCLGIYEGYLRWLRMACGDEAETRKLVKSEAFQLLAQLMQNIALTIALLNHPEDCDAATLRAIEAGLPSMVQEVTGLMAEANSRTQGPRPRPDKVYVFQMRITDIEPPISRVVAIPGNRSLGEVHAIVQRAFGWSDSHLHDFVVRGQRYAEPSEDDEIPSLDEGGFTLDELSLRARSKILYNYDFGDGWTHELVVTTSLPFGAEMEDRPACLGGSRAAPPEDCGGIPGYEDLLAAIGKPASKRNEEEKDLVAWAGKYKPETFDAKKVNKGLSRL